MTNVEGDVLMGVPKSITSITDSHPSLGPKSHHRFVINVTPPYSSAAVLRSVVVADEKEIPQDATGIEYIEVGEHLEKPDDPSEIVHTHDRYPTAYLGGVPVMITTKWPA